MVIRTLYWLASCMNVTLYPWGYQHQIRDLVKRKFFRHVVLEYANLTDNWMLIRDVALTLPDERNWIMAEMLVSAKVPLRLVANWASPEVVGWMLEMEVNPNPYEDFGKTALHAAVENGDDSLEIARILLDRGAEIQAVDQHNYTPLQRTLQLRCPILQMVKLLVSKGAKVNSVANNITPLLTAVTFNQPLSVIKFLVKHGANPIEERTLEDGETVLHRASVHQRSDLIDYFLHLGMDVNVRSKSGLNLVSRQVIEDCDPKFLMFLMSRNVVVDTAVLRWMLSCSSNVKHAREKLQLFFLYAKMEMSRNFYSAGLTLTLSDEGLCHNGFDWAVSMLEIIALSEFLMLGVECGNRWFLDRHTEFRKHFLDCKKELQRMKYEKLHGEVTLLNLLTDDVTKVCQYMRNKNMVQGLEKTDFKNCPIYRVYLEHVLRYVNEQYKLEEETAARLAQQLRFNSHDSFVWKIVNFLEPRDMRKFLTCFE